MLFFSTAHAQPGKLKGLGGLGKKDKGKSTAPASVNNDPTQGPAKYAINDFNRYRKRAQEILDSGKPLAYEDGVAVRSNYLKELEAMKKALNDIKVKDAKAAGDYEEAYAKYEQNWTDYQPEVKKLEEKIAAGKADQEARNEPWYYYQKEIEGKVDRIAFSNSTISSTSPIDGDKNLSASGKVYARAYFNVSPKELFPKEKHHIQLYIDGLTESLGKRFKVAEVSGDKYLDLTVIPPQIIIKEEGEFNQKVRWMWFKELVKLTPGEHTVKMLLSKNGDISKGNDGFAALVGEFTLNIDDATIAKWKKDISAYEYELLKNVELPKKGGMSNSSLTADAIRIFKEEKLDMDEAREKVIKTAKGAYIAYTNEWNITKNDYTGVIKRRWVDVVVKWKDVEDNCGYTEVRIEQLRLEGKYGSSQFSGVGSGTKVLCEKL